MMLQTKQQCQELLDKLRQENRSQKARELLTLIICSDNRLEKMNTTESKWESRIRAARVETVISEIEKTHKR